MSGPFKMKGSPMKRNFGIGASPAKQKPKYPGQAEEPKIKSKSQIEYEKEMYPTGKKDNDK
jgi:hypothetical protein